MLYINILHKYIYSYATYATYAGRILESKDMCVIVQKTGKKGCKWAKYMKRWAKMYKFEFFLKNNSLMCMTIACMKQLEYALYYFCYCNSL